LNGKHKGISEKLKTLHPNSIKIASIIKAELLLGVEKSIKKNETLEKLSFFLKPFEVISFDDKAAMCYARIRAERETQGTIISPNNLILAATVLYSL
jgi:tRNA(fMet)-specific endonuclease VapC